MAYATVQELAEAMRVQIAPSGIYSEEVLQACLDAAAIEIDDAVDRTEPIPADDPLAKRVNLARGYEWWKSVDAAFGIVGFADTGALRAPTDPFGRHAAALLPLREQFGVA